MPSSRAAPTTRAMWLAPPSRKINRSCAIAPIGPIPQSQQRDWEAAGPGRPRGRRVLRHSCQHNKRKNDELRNSDDLPATPHHCRDSFRAIARARHCPDSFGVYLMRGPLSTMPAECCTSLRGGLGLVKVVRGRLGVPGLLPSTGPAWCASWFRPRRCTGTDAGAWSAVAASLFRSAASGGGVRWHMEAGDFDWAGGNCRTAQPTVCSATWTGSAARGPHGEITL